MAPEQNTSPHDTALEPASDNSSGSSGYIEDTIVALATPPGRGGVAIVRLSGNRALELAQKICAAKLAKQPRHSFLTRIISPEDKEAIDQALVTYFQQPASFTGEDMVEFSTHGGVITPSRVIRLLLKLGARQALPGEFTQRAFINGKLDLAEAEALNEIISSLSRRSQQVAFQNLEGHLSREIASIRTNLLSLLVILEHELDFNEAEIDYLTRNEISGQLKEILERLHRLQETAPYGRMIREGVRVVITGEPNAGKSSIFNALAGQERALVTQIPGTTRDSLEAWLDISGFPVCLVDTAGLRSSEDTLEQLSIAKSRQQLESADLVLLLDPIDPVSKGRELEIDTQKTVIYVKSKVDQLATGDELNGQVTTSVIRDDGLDGLTTALQAALQDLIPDQSSIVVTSARQAEGLEKAVAQLEGVLELVKSGQGMDIISAEVRYAAEELAAIIGETSNEDVFEAIFRDFCVGK